MAPSEGAVPFSLSRDWRMKTRDLRHRTCWSKVQYHSVEAADVAAQEAMRFYRDEHGPKLHPWPVSSYECPHCGGWHIGHTPVAKMRLVMSDDEVAAILNSHPEQKRVSRCEVVTCGKKGPHRCEQRGTRHSSGRFVCNHHRYGLPQYVVFTNEEAIAVYRARSRRKEAEREQRVRGESGN